MSTPLTYASRQVPSVRPVPDTPIIGFSPQQETDLTGTGFPSAQVPPLVLRPLLMSRHTIARPSLPPFPVAISIAYVLALLGTGLYFVLSN